MNDAVATNAARVRALIDRGVSVPFPEGVSIGSTVVVDRIAAGVVLYSGVRLEGAETSIGRGAVIGEEGPATIVDCQVGPDVHLKGGAFQESTFLAGASLGLAAHVRPGCLLEERASGAHAVGLKQTILMPFVTLGSLANFCDCLMAGGTSRKDHSEVGSSYIHFNFTPHQDKATASMFGDVPRGVMLDQPAVFLGGQGGTVGPVRLGFGTLVAAGTIVRKDAAKGNALITERPPSARPETTFVQGCYRSVERIVRNNVIYIANLHALRLWYEHVRRRFFTKEDAPLLTGALARLDAALQERLKRLGDLAEKMPTSVALARVSGVDEMRVEQQAIFGSRGEALVAALRNPPDEELAIIERDEFLGALDDAIKQHGGAADGAYLRVIRGLAGSVKANGTAWLDAVVMATADAAQSALPGFKLRPPERVDHG